MAGTATGGLLRHAFTARTLFVFASPKGEAAHGAANRRWIDEEKVMFRPRQTGKVGPEMPRAFVRCVLFLTALLAVVAAGPAAARESLGLYGTWGAFRDPVVPRCYAIAMAERNNLWRDYQPFVAVGTWPRRSARNQLHFRLSRKLGQSARITLSIGGRYFPLTGGGGDAWPRDERDNAAIIAAMRSAPSMTVTAQGANGGRFFNRWPLGGAASAMDAALIGCARLR
ncbi:MAG TPA: hypothetical protein VJQ77_11865 [Novosphingobium sp.]|nr:hypothetical protein [Novosphingobium sp.]